MPLKPGIASVWDRAAGRLDYALPAIDGLTPHPAATDTPTSFAAVWSGESAPPTPLATIQATIALALLALGQASDAGQAMDRAASVWMQRQ